MEKDKLIEQMLVEKGNKNNSIDLDAYARGLIDMYDKLVLPQVDVRTSFITSFKDKYGHQIKEGDIIREVIFQDKEKYHYEERFDMMGNEKVTRIIDDRFKVKGLCLRQIKWSKDCLIAERIKDSGTISTSVFDYLNDAFMGVNSTQDVEIIGSIYDGWTLGNYA